MKKSTLIIFFLFVLMKTHAQDYLISFAGTGDTTGVSTITVYNLTSGDTANLNGGDVLHLKPGLGIDSQESNNNPVKIQANPMIDQAVLTFNAPDNSEAVIAVFDISGMTVYKNRYSVSPGENKFRISGIKQGMYLVKISGRSYNYSTKLISLGSRQSDPRIDYVSSSGIPKSTILKSSSSTIDMRYTTGDLLLYRGTAGLYGTVITDVPTGSKTMTFDFVLCQDNEGHNYTTVRIGTQVWMTVNLITSRYSDGTPIPLVTDSAVWSNLASPGFCWYNNDSAGNIAYGALYNWFAVNTGKLAPSGWHIPSDSELTILTTYLGGESVAGGKLKETGSAHWRIPNAGSTNESGFTALPGGHRDVNGTFSAMGDDGYWWSSTEYGTTGKAWYRNMNYNYGGVVNVSSNKTNGYSVRCIQNLGGFSIGQHYGGGIIFYIDSTGQHGLISSATDQGPGTGTVWGCDTTLVGTSTAIGTGQANTTAIVNGCPGPAIAARICDELVLNGYSDWFLPSLDELNQMYLQQDVIGGFVSYRDYWSSSEYYANGAWGQIFSNGGQHIDPKVAPYFVRAIRAF